MSFLFYKGMEPKGQQPLAWRTPVVAKSTMRVNEPNDKLDKKQKNVYFVARTERVCIVAPGPSDRPLRLADRATLGDAMVTLGKLPS